MKTDREFLELAAKAAGYAVDWREWVRSHVAEFATVKHVKCAGFWLDGEEWNPLTDDGDALRLAVKLRLTVSWDRFDDEDYATATPPHTHQGYDCMVSQDPYAATRRAITRAAAAIGESMP